MVTLSGGANPQAMSDADILSRLDHFDRQSRQMEKARAVACQRGIHELAVQNPEAPPSQRRRFDGETVVAGRQIFTPDREGYLSETWYRLQRPGSSNGLHRR